MCGVDQPGINAAAHGGQHDPEELVLPARGADVEQQEVVVLAIDEV